MTTVPGKRSGSDPELRDRLYELLERDDLPQSGGSRFARLIVAIIALDVLAAILASEPEIDARFGALLTTIEIAAVIAFALEYAARLWSVVGHSLRDMTPLRARLEYAFSALGLIDLLAFLPSAVALLIGDKTALVLFGMLPFLKLVRYSPALRSLLSGFGGADQVAVKAGRCGLEVERVRIFVVAGVEVASRPVAGLCASDVL